MISFRALAAVLILILDAWLAYQFMFELDAWSLEIKILIVLLGMITLIFLRTSYSEMFDKEE